MWFDGKLSSSSLILRCLDASDASNRYLTWLHDRQVNRYLEIRHAPPDSIENLRKFIEDIKSSVDSIIFGIYLEIDGRHIGNIKLGPINKIHKRAEIGIIFGEREEWGKGYATEAIKLLAKFAFTELNLNRLTAGCYEENVGSLRAFQKAGFQLEATLPNHWILESGEPTSELLLGLNAPKKRNSERCLNLGDVDSIVFIGGGKLMLKAMQMAQKLGFSVGALLAKRHASEFIDAQFTLEKSLTENGLPYQVLSNVDEINSSIIGEASKCCIALCFGPAWIFPDEVIDRFSAGMMNFNGIPIPRYLGGAHYTWQILNGYKRTGCHIQLITSNVDRGDLIMSADFNLASKITVPSEYFDENEDIGIDFLTKFFQQVKSRVDFKLVEFSELNNARLYFPRLITRENGWINWCWDGRHILSFCRAFASPYPGASTFCNGVRISLLKVEHIHDIQHESFHPFCSGLVVRVEPTNFCVAVSDGILRVTLWKVEEGADAFVIREGDRMHTDLKTLELATLFRPKINGSSFN
jgi:RimJ/RimL family protein N-acetyltransferase/methionyl-tRNA formyltransferase